MQLFRPMQSIALEVEDGENAGTYSSLVLDFTEGEQITVGAPLARGREVQLAPDTPVRLQFMQPDGIYLLSSRVLERSRHQPSLRLAWPDNQECIQRRSHPRADILARCNLWLQDPVSGNERTVPALSTNLSAGGVRVTLAEALKPGLQVRITLHLPGAGDRTSEAHVTRAGESPGAPMPQRFWAALEFAGLLESVREDLTHFVLEVQREQLHKGVA
jgi:c-di-GMP-binding flagellar brake protein YcgR